MTRYMLQKHYRRTEAKLDIFYSKSLKGRAIDFFFCFFQILISREPGIFLVHTFFLEGCNMYGKPGEERD